MGKGDRRKKPRQKMQVREHQENDMPHTPRINAADIAIRPTPEQYQRGTFRLPQGMGKHGKPAINEIPDAVAYLHAHGTISTSHEQAARRYQEIHAAYMAELGASQGRSCLDMTPVGHDTGEGDPEVCEAWRSLSKRLGWVKEGVLQHTTIQGHMPRNLTILRDALDVVAGVARTRKTC